MSTGSEIELDSQQIFKEINDFIFEAFEKRPIPKEPFILPLDELQDIESVLRSVDRREITLDFVDEMGLYPSDWIPYMSVEGLLHYFPCVLSLSLEELIFDLDRESMLDYAIMTAMLPWYFFTPPHEWIELSRELEEDATFRLPWLFDDEIYYNLGGGNLMLALEPLEKEALRSYIQYHPDMSSEFPLFVYGANEILDGRVEVGDRFSWLPRHEKRAVVAFIDYFSDQFQDSLRKEELDIMLKVRNSKDLA